MLFYSDTIQERRWDVLDAMVVPVICRIRSVSTTASQGHLTRARDQCLPSVGNSRNQLTQHREGECLFCKDSFRLGPRRWLGTPRCFCYPLTHWQIFLSSQVVLRRSKRFSSMPNVSLQHYNRIHVKSPRIESLSLNQTSWENGNN